MSITISDILAAAVAVTGQTREDITGPSRLCPLVHHRQAAIAAAVIVTGKSSLAIGRAFGGRDHTTVLHAVRACEDDPERREIRDAIIAKVDEWMCWQRDWVSAVPFRSRRALVQFRRAA